MSSSTGSMITSVASMLIYFMALLWTIQTNSIQDNNPGLSLRTTHARHDSQKVSINYWNSNSMNSQDIGPGSQSLELKTLEKASKLMARNVDL